jgi:ERF superfamily
MATAQTLLNPAFTWWRMFWPFRRSSQALVPAPAMLPAVDSTPPELLRLAVSQNADLAKLSHLMDLQERWEKNEAKKAYVAAMNGFKANPPEITKNEIAEFVGKNGEIVEWEYSTLDHIHDAILSELSRHGISHRWIVEQPQPEIVRVTCVLTHKLGHSEQTTLQGPVDHSGSKNAIQAIGSSAKYLERYTLMAATGLADRSPDTDGLAGAQTKANGWVAESLSKIKKAATLDQLRDAYRVAYNNAVTKDDQTAKTAIIAAKNARQKELR